MVRWLGFIGPPILRMDRSSKAVLFIKLSTLFLLRPALFLFQVFGLVSHQLADISGLFFSFLIPLRQMLHSNPLASD